jgi:hypothetical protein
MAMTSLWLERPHNHTCLISLHKTLPHVSTQDPFGPVLTNKGNDLNVVVPRASGTVHGCLVKRSLTWIVSRAPNNYKRCPRSQHHPYTHLHISFQYWRARSTRAPPNFHSSLTFLPTYCNVDHVFGFPRGTMRRNKPPKASCSNQATKIVYGFHVPGRTPPEEKAQPKKDAEDNYDAHPTPACKPSSSNNSSSQDKGKGKGRQTYVEDDESTSSDNGPTSRRARVDSHDVDGSSSQQALRDALRNSRKPAPTNPQSTSADPGQKDNVPFSKSYTDNLRLHATDPVAKVSENTSWSSQFSNRLLDLEFPLLICPIFALFSVLAFIF